jgi:hypothetical protein
MGIATEAGGRARPVRAAGAGPEADELARVVGPEPTLEFAAMVAEEFIRRLNACPTRRCDRSRC